MAWQTEEGESTQGPQGLLGACWGGGAGEGILRRRAVAHGLQMSARTKEQDRELPGPFSHQSYFRHSITSGVLCLLRQL